MATLPATNPTIPFLARIPGGLHHGSMIRIIGRKTGYESPIINIQCGPAMCPSDDVNLHLSIRTYENAIVRNHYQNHGWGTEERSGGCPIRDHEQFEILILAQNNCFKIAVNGRHFCEFVHRLPFNTSNYLLINGAVHVTSVKLEYDSPQATAPPVPMNMSYQSMAYQPPPTYQQTQTQFQPMHQQHIQTPYPQYGSISATTHATPASSGYPIQCTQYYSPNAQPMPHHYQYNYSNPHNVYGQHHYQPNNNSSKSNTMLKYAAGIGGIGLGAYALSHLLDNNSHECYDSD